MEILIEAMIWLFRNLFGDRQEPADMSQRPPEMPRRSRTNSSPRPGGQPLTLEEILQEARREAQSRQSGFQTPKPVAQAPAASPAPPAPPRQRTLAERLEAADQAAAAAETAMAERRADAGALPFRPATRLEQIQQPRKAAPRPPLERAPKPKPQEIEAQPEIRRAAGRAALAVSADESQSMRRPKREDLSFLSALKRGTTSEKRAALRQAVILKEILDAPRALRPCRPASRR